MTSGNESRLVRSVRRVTRGIFARHPWVEAALTGPLGGLLVPLLGTAAGLLD